jgi:hypothetical protein
MIQTRPSFRFLEIYVGFYIAASTFYSTLVRHTRLLEHNLSKKPIPPKPYEFANLNQRAATEGKMGNLNCGKDGRPLESTTQG